MRRVVGRAAVARLERYIEELKQADTPPIIVLLMDERIGKRVMTNCSAHREGCPRLPCQKCQPCKVATEVDRKPVFIIHDVPRPKDD